MAIALVATNGATQTAVGGGTLSVPVPTGTVSGDVLVILVSVVSSSTVPATPSGLTLLDSASTGPSYASYYRVCDGTEPASYGFTVTKRAAGISVTYSGVNTTTPINAHGAPNKTTTTSATATTITTTANGCRLIFASTIGTASETFTNPTGFANQVLETSSSNNTLAFCDESQTTAGATGTITGTWSAANNNFSQLIALAPASGGTANTLTASPGSIAVTGNATTLPVAHKPSANPGAMAITGTAATLPVAHKPTFSPGAMAITGAAVFLPAAHKPTLSPGSVVITGDATLLPVAHKPTVSPGSFVITGDPVVLPMGRVLVAAPGAVIITGDSATLVGPGGAVVVAVPDTPWLPQVFSIHSSI